MSLQEKQDYEALIRKCIRFENSTKKQCQEQKQKLSELQKAQNENPDLFERHYPRVNPDATKEPVKKPKVTGKNRSASWTHMDKKDEFSKENLGIEGKLPDGKSDRNDSNNISDLSQSTNSAKPKRSLKDVMPKIRNVSNSTRPKQPAEQKSNLNNIKQPNSNSTQQTMIFQGSFDNDDDFCSVHSSKSKCCYPHCTLDNSDPRIAVHANCQQWMHTKCFVEWVYAQRKGNKQLTCPYCKKPFFAPA